MFSGLKFSYRRTLLTIFIGLITLVNFASAGADSHLSIQVSDQSAFRSYFWLNGRFGGVLSDFIELADGTHEIEVFGPTDQEYQFYSLKTVVEVVGPTPQVRSVSFKSECQGKGVRNRVKDWPTPLIFPDRQQLGAFRVVIETPSMIARDVPCVPPPDRMVARWADLGVLKLSVTSTPVGAEVWIRGERTATTNTTINVPYHNEKEKIDVVIRMPGRVNCNYELQGPFEGEAQVHCIPKNP